MKQKLRLYDIVRPTEEWIKDRMEVPFISLVGFMSDKEENEIKANGERMFKKGVGYVSMINGDDYYVNWLTDSQSGHYYLYNAWWHKDDLEVIGNALKICKDLI